MGKAIYADYKIGQAYHSIDADIKGECKTRKAIFTDCKATIHHDGHSVEKTFAFFDFTSGDYTVTAIAANDNPANITLDIAVDKIMNRAVFALMFLAAVLLCLWLALYGLFITLPRSRALLAGLNRKEAQPWQLTEIERRSGDQLPCRTQRQNRQNRPQLRQRQPVDSRRPRRQPLAAGLCPARWRRSGSLR